MPATFGSKRSHELRPLWVPDLLPPDLRAVKVVFIGESPHRDEVAPESEGERTPFRGMAGGEWWTALSRFLPESAQPKTMKPVPPRAELIEICEELSIAVLNAVQFPIDPKITLHQGESSHPRVRLGFEKGSGIWGYRAVFSASGYDGPVGLAICGLASRLMSFSEGEASLVCLGKDAEWFVKKALNLLQRDRSTTCKPWLRIDHPSSWRRNSAYRERAAKVLEDLLSKKAAGNSRHQAGDICESDTARVRPASSCG